MQVCCCIADSLYYPPDCVWAPLRHCCLAAALTTTIVCISPYYCVCCVELHRFCWLVGPCLDGPAAAVVPALPVYDPQKNRSFPQKNRLSHWLWLCKAGECRRRAQLAWVIAACPVVCAFFGQVCHVGSCGSTAARHLRPPSCTWQLVPGFRCCHGSVYQFLLAVSLVWLVDGTGLSVLA